MPIRLGNKADGDDFFDRESERDDLWRYLEANHVVLSGPRRLGKTSLLQRLADEATAKGLLARLIDVEGIDSAAAFVAAIDSALPDDSLRAQLQAMGRHAGDWLTRLKKVEVKIPGGAGGSVEWQSLPDPPWRDAAHAMQCRLSATPVLLLIDEVSVALKKLLDRDAAEAASLLSWLRTWRQQSGLVCRFLFSGSIGLNALLARYQLTTYFNDCHDFRLGPFKRPAALAMLGEQVRRENWATTTQVLEHLCQRTGWLSPYYLNLLLNAACEAARDRCEETGISERRVLISDVDDAYDRLLATRSRFIHWRQRLERDLDEPQRSFTLALLAAVARADDGLSRRQLLARLARLEDDADRRADRLDQAMLLLDEDGYLDTNGERIRFLSFLLRDYWRRNHGR